jgi:hypothetical protein
VVDARGCTGVAIGIRSCHGPVNTNKVPSRPNSAGGGVVYKKKRRSELEVITVAREDGLNDEVGGKAGWLSMV